MRVLEVYVKTDDILINQVKEREKVESFNIFDAIVYGMQSSVNFNKQEKDKQNDRSK